MRNPAFRTLPFPLSVLRPLAAFPPSRLLSQIFMFPSTRLFPFGDSRIYSAAADLTCWPAVISAYMAMTVDVAPDDLYGCCRSDAIVVVLRLLPVALGSAVRHGANWCCVE